MKGGAIAVQSGTFAEDRENKQNKNVEDISESPDDLNLP